MINPKLNDYSEQFNSEVDLSGLVFWFIDNLAVFIPNLTSSKPIKRPLKEWIRVFLLWSEYEDNK